MAHSFPTLRSSDLASALVVGGIYRVTRNPMYLGFALLLGGWVLALASLPGVIVTVAFVLYLNHFQIPPEEAAIGVRFGEAFDRSEEHTSELQSLMRISYAVFCLKKKSTTSI